MYLIYTDVSNKIPRTLMMKETQKKLDQLHLIFLEKHREWEAVNNPKGIESGEMQKKWNERIEALLNFVRTKQASEA